MSLKSKKHVPPILQWHYPENTQASRIAHPFCLTKHFWAVGPPLSPSAGLSLSAPIANIYRSSSALSRVDRTY
jgi:hypothetical protein